MKWLHRVTALAEIVVALDVIRHPAEWLLVGIVRQGPGSEALEEV